ncbi:MAG: type II toxin-antitoxin system death-on-curing family toxin [Proteobacteria bacterium]|nr:type II toxin-antitoxin system death-on-curing family toxin [Pseudomonadota bacterium]
MSQPKWLLQSIIEAIHDAQIAEHGGLSGIRDKGLLSSALARPKNLYEYEQANLYELAASYAFALARNHPFVDGNKRTAFLAAYIFLSINGIIFTAPETETTAIIIALAANEIDEDQLAKWLKQHSATESGH